MGDEKVWFITGSSSGIGRALAEEALAQGERVVATARRPEVLDDLVDGHPGSALAVRLDVTSRREVEQAVHRAVEVFGRLDVVVNNAGYGLIGALEEPSDEQIRGQFETNVFGVLNVVREALPVLRRQGRGHIINVSSSLGFHAVASYGYYSATKFALQGLSEALAAETAALGIKVTIAEPGGTRTEFVTRGMVDPAHPLPEVYPSTGALSTYLARTDGRQHSDPRKVARVLIDVADLADPPLHLPLGVDAHDAIGRHLARNAEEIRLGRERALRTGC